MQTGTWVVVLKNGAQMRWPVDAIVDPQAEWMDALEGRQTCFAVTDTSKAECVLMVETAEVAAIYLEQPVRRMDPWPPIPASTDWVGQP